MSFARTASARIRRGVAASAVAGALLVGGVAVAPAAHAAAPCPTGGIGFTSNLSNGSININGIAKSSGNSATACGLITPDASGNLNATIQPDNIQFAPGSTKILFLSLPTTISAVGPITGVSTFGADGLNVNLTGSLQATTKLLVFTCTLGPITSTLTTGTSGKLTGKPFTNPGFDLSAPLAGTLVTGDFVVPAVKPSRSCPGFVAALTNILVGLPSKPGKSSISFDGTLQLG